MYFHTNYKIISYIMPLFLIVITFNLYIALGSMDNVTALIITAHEHGVISFSLCHLQFLSWKPKIRVLVYLLPH